MKIFKETVANKTLFDLLLKLAAQPLKVYSQTKASDHHDDCNDKQTRQRKPEDTSDSRYDKYR